MATRLGLPPAVLGLDEHPPGRARFAWRRRMHGPTRAGLKIAAHVLPRRLLREQLDRWDGVLRPETAMAGSRLGLTDPAVLDDTALAAHLRICLAHLEHTLEEVAALGLASGIALHDFAHACQVWAGATPSELAALFPREGPLRAGMRHEIAALRSALAEAPWPGVAAGADPAATLLALAAHQDDLGLTLRPYLGRVRLRVLGGLDLREPTVQESPLAMHQWLQELSAAAGRAMPGEGSSARIAALRKRVPEAQRATFERMLGETRATRRLIEEPTQMGLAWALGLTRLALLEIARRAQTAGRVADAEVLFDIPAAALLDWLHQADAPLPQPVSPQGAALAPAIPAAWLPQGAQRLARAARAACALPAD